MVLRIFLLALFLIAGSWVGMGSVSPETGDKAGGLHLTEVIEGFSLTYYHEDGSKAWELKGEKAVDRNGYLEIDNVKADYYSEKEVFTATADRGRLSREDMNVFLHDNVVITGESGIRFYTDFLLYKSKPGQIETEEAVRVEKDGFEIKAEGFEGKTGEKTGSFKRRVNVFMPEEDSGEITTIKCDGPLHLDYDRGQAVFNNNVTMESERGTVNSDRAVVSLDTEGKEIVTVVSEGNVKITRGSNVTRAQKATYYNKEERLLIDGKPQLIFFPDEDIRN